MNNWPEQFDKEFGVHIEGQWTNDNYPAIKSFISQEIEKAKEEGKVEALEQHFIEKEALREEGRQEGYTEFYNNAPTLTNKIRQEERTRILKLIEEMKLKRISDFEDAWNQALEELKRKLND